MRDDQLKGVRATCVMVFEELDDAQPIRDSWARAIAPNLMGGPPAGIDWDVWKGWVKEFGVNRCCYAVCKAAEDVLMGRRD